MGGEGKNKWRGVSSFHVFSVVLVACPQVGKGVKIAQSALVVQIGCAVPRPLAQVSDGEEGGERKI